MADRGNYTHTVSPIHTGDPSKGVQVVFSVVDETQVQLQPNLKGIRVSGRRRRGTTGLSPIERVMSMSRIW